MDWERTKTVLILAFLLLNTVFVFQLWLAPTYFDSSMRITPSQIEDKLAELQYSNISVTAKVPNRLHVVQMLTVRCPEPDYYKVATAVLGQGLIQVSPANAALGYRKYISETGDLTIYTNGRIVFKSSHGSGRQDVSSETAQVLAEEFLHKSLGLPQDAKLGRGMRTEGGEWVIQYYQRWKRKDLEISRITLVVGENGVISMDYYWVDIIGFTGAEVTTIPATGALTVAAELMPSGSIITEIYPSWYSPPVRAEQWRSYPVWVIETANGSRYYVNAFTGELEGKEDFLAGKPGPMLN